MMTSTAPGLRWPQQLTVREVGPREGFQSHEKVVPTEIKADVLRHLVKAGFRRINAVSLVNPKLMPQVGDAEALLDAVGPLRGVAVSALVPNGRGLDRAIALAKRDLIQEALFIHAMTESVLQVNGIRMGRESWRNEIKGLAERAKDAGLATCVFVSAAYGCSIEGPVELDDVFTEFDNLFQSPHIDEIVISDSTGQATPPDAYRMFDRYRATFGPHAVTAHFHDSRGAALANVVAVLQTEVRNLTVDAAFGGLGGDVPFLPEAAGNLASEDLLYMCEASGIDAGIDLTEVYQASLLAKRAYLGARAFPARVLSLLETRTASDQSHVA